MRTIWGKNIITKLTWYGQATLEKVQKRTGVTKGVMNIILPASP